MPLDPQVVALYKDKNERKHRKAQMRRDAAAPHFTSSNEAAYDTSSIEEQVRLIREDADEEFNDKKNIISIFRTEDRFIPRPLSPLPIRLYIPGKRQNYPVILYFHGGGFVIHNIASHDSLCRKLAVSSDCIVISVGYRLAPENPYPAAIEDGFLALEWAARNAHTFGGVPDGLIVAGDSAGATISSALSLLARDSGGPDIAAQLLFYGTYGCVSDDESESMKKFGGGEYVLARSQSDWFMDKYLPKNKKMQENSKDSGEVADPYLFPGKAQDLSGLPRTLVITAEYDPLRDDGEAFAKKLKEHGTAVDLLRMNGMMHGFMLYWHRFSRAEILLENIGQWIHTSKIEAPDI